MSNPNLNDFDIDELLQPTQDIKYGRRASNSGDSLADSRPKTRRKESMQPKEAQFTQTTKGYASVMIAQPEQTALQYPIPQDNELQKTAQELSIQMDDLMKQLKSSIDESKAETVKLVNESLVQELQYSGEAYKEQTVEEVGNIVQQVQVNISKKLDGFDRQISAILSNVEQQLMKSVQHFLNSQKATFLEDVYSTQIVVQNLASNLTQTLSDMQIERAALIEMFEDKQIKLQSRVDKFEMHKEQLEMYLKGQQEVWKATQEKQASEMREERENWLAEKKIIQDQIQRVQLSFNQLQQQIQDKKLQLEKESLHLDRIKDQAANFENRKKQLDDRERDVESMYTTAQRMKKEVTVMVQEVDLLREEAQHMKQQAFEEKQALEFEKEKFNTLRVQFAKQQSANTQLLQENVKQNTVPWTPQDYPWRKQ